MAIAEILEFAKARIPLEIAKDENRLQVEITRITSEANARGMLHSSSYILLIQEACAKAARERIKTAWEVLHRGITTVGVEYDETLDAEFKEAIEAHFPEHMNGLKYRVIETANRIGMPDITSRIPDEIQNSRNAALAEVASEIKLFLMTLKNRPTTMPYSPQFNFHNSTIGAVQSGNQSVAHVQLQTGVSAGDLIKALDTVSQSLSKISNIPGHDKAEIIELISEGKIELTKEKPNKTKLAAYLPTISSALGLVAELKPAYEGLKAAANAFSIQMP
jgi:hypothetical protein